MSGGEEKRGAREGVRTAVRCGEGEREEKRKKKMSRGHRSIFKSLFNHRGTRPVEGGKEKKKTQKDMIQSFWRERQKERRRRVKHGEDLPFFDLPFCLSARGSKRGMRRERKERKEHGKSVTSIVSREKRKKKKQKDTR